MATFQSPAFLQQCFAMHRMDLVVRQIKGQGIVIRCRQCSIRHTLRVSAWEVSPDNGHAPVLSEALLACAREHPKAVTLHQVDVVRDYVDLACAECRTTHPFRLVECVTRPIEERPR